jgi:hypothetical protein
MELVKESWEKYTVGVEEEVRQVVKEAWDFETMKRVMSEMNIDVERLPLGKLQRDQITKCYIILT